VHPEARSLGLAGLLRAGLRRSCWQAAAGIFAGLVAAAALVAALSLLQAMGQMLDEGLGDLGGDIVLALPKDRPLVERWLATGSTEPIEARIDAAMWQRWVEEAQILGLREIEPVDLTQGAAGVPASAKASLLVLRLEFWASPMMAEVEIETAVPGAAVVVGEQATRHVLTDLQPLVRHLSRAAGVAVLGAILISGLLTSIRVGQRRAELGMLRAMGATRSFLIRLTVGESVVLAVAGGLLGSLLAVGVLWLLPGARALLRYLPVVQLLGLVGIAVVGTGLASALAALGPAIQTARLDPLDAVRRHR